jgi:hypothetical protein
VNDFFFDVGASFLALLVDYASKSAEIDYGLHQGYAVHQNLRRIANLEFEMVGGEGQRGSDSAMEHKGKGKAKVEAKDGAHGEGKQPQGKTYRAPKPHAACTNEKNPGMLTKLPQALYARSTTPGRSSMREHIQEELDALEMASVERKASKKAKTSASKDPEDELEVKEDEDDEKPASLFNTRGNRIPDKSPEGLLTGERDGSEHAKVLVSPLSYGRTEASMKFLRRRARDSW